MTEIPMTAVFAAEIEVTKAPVPADESAPTKED